MNKPRKTPRIYVNFKSLEVMDDIELFANKQGLDLQNWIRKLVFEERKDRQLQRRIAREQFASILAIKDLLGGMVDNDTRQASNRRAEEYIKFLEDVAAQK